jgi:hypothetical protein
MFMGAEIGMLIVETIAKILDERKSAAIPFRGSHGAPQPLSVIDDGRRIRRGA